MFPFFQNHQVPSAYTRRKALFCRKPTGHYPRILFSVPKVKFPWFSPETPQGINMQFLVLTAKKPNYCSLPFPWIGMAGGVRTVWIGGGKSGRALCRGNFSMQMGDEKRKRHSGNCNYRKKCANWTFCGREWKRKGFF